MKMVKFYKIFVLFWFLKYFIFFIYLLIFLGDGNLDFSEVNDILKRRVFYANSKNDFKQESRSIGEFFMKGINFIKDNLWFLK